MTFAFDQDGWLLRGGRKRISPHFDDRPADVTTELCVIHNISLPAGRYGGPHIEALFLGAIDTASDPSFSDLEGVRVSSHFLIRRDGETIQFVSLLKRAWHAGRSRFQEREACNDFSVGIELEGCDTDAFTEPQIAQAVLLLAAIGQTLPGLRWVVGHSDIAPDRKTDPGPYFPWADFLGRLAAQGCHLTRPLSDTA
jgi:AmpD protein